MLLTVPLAPQPAAGQSSIQFAPRLGASVATVQSDTASNTSWKTSIMGGVAMRVPLRGPVSLQPALNVVPRGATVSGQGGGETRFSAVYAEVPVHVQGDLPSIGTVTPFLLGGGYGAVKIFEQQSIGGSGARVPVNLDQSFYRRFDAGLSGGAGASLGRGLSIVVRYSYGLLDVVQDVDTPPFEDAPEQRPPGDGTSSAWSITASFGF
jgi:hypothetical protein